MQTNCLNLCVGNKSTLEQAVIGMVHGHSMSMYLWCTYMWQTMRVNIDIVKEI